MAGGFRRPWLIKFRERGFEFREIYRRLDRGVLDGNVRARFLLIIGRDRLIAGYEIFNMEFSI